MTPSPSGNAETLAAVVKDQAITVIVDTPMKVAQDPRSEANNQTTICLQGKRKYKQ